MGRSADERRKKIVEMLKRTDTPLSGTRLSEALGVSRQIIVQDIALLRAENEEIIATARGYYIRKEPEERAERVIWVSHNDAQIEQELTIFADLGVWVKDVIVEHPVYGVITGLLNVRSRRDVKEFMKRYRTSQAPPLLVFTNGAHGHTAEAESEEVLDEAEEELRRAGIEILKR